MASNPPVIEFASREAMAARLADLVTEAALHGSLCDGHADLALSGGSTPQALYEAFAARDLPWAQMRITLVDERWVPLSHPRSNEAFIRNAFQAAEGAKITGLYNGAAAPHGGVGALEGVLDARQKPFDVVVLGMGGDGHTASWFPHAEGLSEALETDAGVCAITAQKSDVTGDEVERITLSLSAVAAARLVVLMITGDEKRTAFERASEAGPVEDMPVRAILRARPDLWLCWAP